MSTRRIFGALLAAGLTVLSLSGCEPTVPSGGATPPTPEAQAYFDAWKNGDQTAAAALAKAQSVVDKTFTVAYNPADDWLFIGCDAGYIYRYCRWVDRYENSFYIQVVMTVDRTNQKIGDFVRSSASTPANIVNIKKAFRALRDDDKASVQGLMNAPGWAEYSALPKYTAADEWGLPSCGQNPSFPMLACTWKNKWNNAISIVSTLEGVIYGATFDQYYG